MQIQINNSRTIHVPFTYRKILVHVPFTYQCSKNTIIMARGQRFNVDYFPHDCKSSRELQLIEKTYGNDGYVVWYKLMEQLSISDNHYIDINEEINLLFLCGEFNVDFEKVELIFETLLKLNILSKRLYSNKILFCQDLVVRLEDAYKKRTTNIITY
jgi:hypothetical protein